jgi:hypothetical protein
LWGHLVFTSVNKCNVTFAINDQLQGPSAVFWDAEHLPRPRKDQVGTC